MTDQDRNAQWSEQDSQAFAEYGRYFVPEREEQIRIICDLIPASDAPFTVIELASGEGLLAEAILGRFPQAQVIGLDGSPEMLRRSTARLESFGSRFAAQQFDLAATDWRTSFGSVHAVVSSLTIHHLDGAGKQALYRDVFGMLAPSGAFVIADLVQPADERSLHVAAQAWDDAVRDRANALGAGQRAVEFFEQSRWNIFRYPEPGETPSTLVDNLRWLSEAGFVHVDAVWLKAGHAIFGGTKASE